MFLVFEYVSETDEGFNLSLASILYICACVCVCGKSIVVWALMTSRSRVARASSLEGGFSGDRCNALQHSALLCPAAGTRKHKSREGHKAMQGHNQLFRNTQT